MLLCQVAGKCVGFQSIYKGSKVTINSKKTNTEALVLLKIKPIFDYRLYGGSICYID